MSEIKFTLVDKCVYVCAKRNSGKTNLVKWFVSMERKLFSKVFLISPSESVSGEYKDIVDPQCILHEYSEEWVDGLIARLAQINRGIPKTSSHAKRVLLIMDDCMSEARWGDSPSLKKILSRGRHVFLSLVCLSQTINGFPPLVRSNSDFILISQLNNQSLETACEEFSNGVDRKEFKALYKANTKDYGFLLINQCQTKDGTLQQSYARLKAPC